MATQKQNFAIKSLLVSVCTLLLINCSDGQAGVVTSDESPPSQAARVVEMGVLNNKVPDGQDIDSLKLEAADSPKAMQGQWQGQFKYAQWDDQSGDVRDIRLDIAFTEAGWAIKGETPHTDWVPGTDIQYDDKTLSFRLKSGLYSGDKRPFPYLVDLVLIDDELEGLIRLRLRSLGDLHSDQFHTMQLERVEEAAKLH